MKAFRRTSPDLSTGYAFCLPKTQVFRGIHGRVDLAAGLGHSHEAGT